MISTSPSSSAMSHIFCLCSDWIALNVLRNVALSTNSVAASVEPTMQTQFLALSPGGSHFATGSSHPSINSQLMAHTPTTASMIAAMGDPFGTVASGVHSHHGASGGFGFEPLSFGSHMDAGVVGGAFDFGTGGGAHGMAMDVISPPLQHTSAPGSNGGAGPDSEMTSPADDGLVKVEGAP